MDIFFSLIIAALFLTVVILFWTYFAKQLYQYFYWDKYQAKRRKAFIAQQDALEAKRNLAQDEQNIIETDYRNKAAAEGQIIHITRKKTIPSMSGFRKKTLDLLGWSGLNFFANMLGLGALGDKEQIARVKTFKYAITHFLKPDAISPSTFVHNFLYLSDSFSGDIKQQDGIQTFSDIKKIPNTYPFWFVAGYPDVFTWFINERSKPESTIHQKYGSTFSPNLLIDGELITPVIRKLITHYTEEINPILEASN
jgi:hypothetical protein